MQCPTCAGRKRVGNVSCKTCGGCGEIRDDYGAATGPAKAESPGVVLANELLKLGDSMKNMQSTLDAQKREIEKLKTERALDCTIDDETAECGECLRCQMNKAIEERDAAWSEAAGHEAEIERLKVNVEVNREVNATLSRKLSEAQAALEVARDSVASTSRRYTQFESQMNDMRAHYERELDVLRASNRALTAIRDEDATESQRWRDEAARREAQVDVQERRMWAAESRSAGFGAEIDNLRAKLAEADRTIADLRVVRQATEDEVARLTARLSEEAERARRAESSIESMCSGERAKMVGDIERAEQAKNNAYRERNTVVALAARMALALGDGLRTAERARDAWFSAGKRAIAESAKTLDAHALGALRAAVDRAVSEVAPRLTPADARWLREIPGHLDTLTFRRDVPGYAEHARDAERHAERLKMFPAEDTDDDEPSTEPVEASEPEAIALLRREVTGTPTSIAALDRALPEALRLYDAARAEIAALNAEFERRFAAWPDERADRRATDVERREHDEEVAKLRAQVADAEARRDLTCAALAMLGSELCNDPKIDPADKSDPRWTPSLLVARELRTKLAYHENLVVRVRAMLGIEYGCQCVNCRCPSTWSKHAGHPICAPCAVREMTGGLDTPELQTPNEKPASESETYEGSFNEAADNEGVRIAAADEE